MTTHPHSGQLHQSLPGAQMLQRRQVFAQRVVRFEDGGAHREGVHVLVEGARVCERRGARGKSVRLGGGVSRQGGAGQRDDDVAWKSWKFEEKMRKSIYDISS